MRPGQQNKRGRGRGNNGGGGNGGGGGGNNQGNFNRKGSNPLTRTFDSSGPDVKIRGTAQHIAEKYATLARDAQSAGDRVMAENYLQHAEHYNRIIAAAQAQMQERFQRDDRPDYQDRDHDRDDDNDNDDRNDGERNEVEERPAPKQAQPAPVVIDGSGPQPIIEGTPAEVAFDSDIPTNDPNRERPAQRRRGAAARPRRQPRGAAGEAGAKDEAGTAEGGDAPALVTEPTS